MTTEPRRARAKYALSDDGGSVTREGEAEAVIGEAGVNVGPVSVSYLDADALRVADYRIELDLWPSGRLALNQIGRRHDTFLGELRRARNQGRVAGLLAHGVTMPEVFEGAVSDAAGPSQAAEIQIYDTHVTLVPQDSDPFQIPFGALASVRLQDEPPAVLLETIAGSTAVGLLGRQRDACRDAIGTRLDAHARVLSELTGQDRFADGLGVPRARTIDFTALVERYTASSRAPCAETLLAGATDDPRLGFVQLLDPEGETLAPPSPLPERWGAFLLVPIGGLTVLEIVAGPAAATYAFRAPIDEVNRDLQLMHFRRAPLALTEEQATPTPTNPHRLALRRLAPLRRLRACTVARLIHNEGWEAGLAGAIR